jgi:hypothetical protein
MYGLLKHEIGKLIINKSVIICFAASAIFAVIIAVLNVRDYEYFTALDILYDIPNGAHGVISFTKNSFILPFVAVYMITSIVVIDYKYNIIRNIIMSGHPRNRIYLAKFIICALTAICLFITCAIIYTVVVTVLIGFGSGVTIFSYITALLHIILHYTAFTAFVLLLSNLTRSTGAALIISLGLTFIFAGISVNAETVSFHADEYLITTNQTMRFIGDLYIGNLIVSAANFHLDISHIIRYILTAAAYLIVSVGMGLYLFEKRDIK